MLNKKGFTLVEVIVVTIVIAALAMLVVPSFKNSALTNQMEKAKIGLIELTTAVKLYNEVNPNAKIPDTLNDNIFNDDMFDKLTAYDEEQDYTYLQNSARWGHRPNSSTEYSLVDATSDAGVLNCRYSIYQSNNPVMSDAICQFNKIDQDGTECYHFYINKNNPAVVQKQFQADGGLCSVL